MRAGEPVQHLAGVVDTGVEQRRGGVGVDVRPGMQAEQLEPAPGRSVEMLQRPGEHRGDRRPGVTARVQQAQPPLPVGQLADQIPDRGPGPAQDQLGNHPQGQR